MKPSLYVKIVSWIITILVPAALTLTAVRLMMTPLFLQFEYNLPGFPADLYGFTKQDRLYWSRNALDYLLNSKGIDFLKNQQFEDGSLVYNQRELHHMLDVKNAIRVVLFVWYISLAGLVLIGVWAWRAGWVKEYRNSLARGGWLTVLLLVAILVLVLFAFGYFFVAFHNVFFQPGTWMFEYTDTLIRLFPERFWRDIFLLVGAISIGGGLVLAYGARQK